METEVKDKTKEVVKTEKKKLTSFKDINISNPIYYNSEVELYSKNDGKSIYKVPKRLGNIYYIVHDNSVKVGAIKD